jgi:hypothetical protein
MTDSVAIALIAGTPGLLAAIGTLITAVSVARSNSHIANTRAKIEELEKNTNSIKDALVNVTGKEAFARGRLSVNEPLSPETMRQEREADQ